MDCLRVSGSALFPCRGRLWLPLLPWFQAPSDGRGAGVVLPQEREMGLPGGPAASRGDASLGPSHLSAWLSFLCVRMGARGEPFGALA